MFDYDMSAGEIADYGMEAFELGGDDRMDCGDEASSSGFEVDSATVLEDAIVDIQLENEDFCDWASQYDDDPNPYAGSIEAMADEWADYYISPYDGFE